MGGTLDGDIETSGDVDYFSFRGQEDWQYEIETTLGTNDDTEIALYAPDGSLIGSDDDGGRNYASRIEWSAPGSGTYYVAVGGVSGATGTYRLTVRGIAPARDDHGDSRASATQVRVDNTVNGDIETSGDVDYFAFRGREDRRYIIETTLGTNDDTEIALYAPDGSLIGSDDDGGRDYASRIEWTAPASGTYYVAVGGISGATGTYWLTVTAVVATPAPAAPAPAATRAPAPAPVATTAPAAPAPAAPARDDHGDSISSATVMRVGDTIDGDIETSGDVDYFSFQGEANWWYAIETSLGTNGDTVLTLYGPDGSFIAEDDDGGREEYASRIEWTDPASGDYYVAVRGYDSTGTYWLTITGGALSAPVAPAPASGRIVFQSDRDGDYEIYVMNADGSGVSRLTDNAANDWVPSWSPDGGRIAFHSDRDGDREIYVMNADGTGVSRLTDNSANDWIPSWSPDGGRIAFYSDRDGDREIYVMNADGTGVSRLTDNTGYDGDPSWSPDGRRIAFHSDRDGNGEIYVMNADGTGVSRLTDSPGGDWYPSWSPDGGRIAFGSDRDGDGEIYVMNADGSGVSRLTDNSANDWIPSWSPDGRRIAFISELYGDYDIYVMNADGSGVVRLTENSAEDQYPSWSPVN